MRLFDSVTFFSLNILEFLLTFSWGFSAPSPFLVKHSRIFINILWGFSAPSPFLVEHSRIFSNERDLCGQPVRASKPLMCTHSGLSLPGGSGVALFRPRKVGSGRLIALNRSASGAGAKPRSKKRGVRVRVENVLAAPESKSRLMRRWTESRWLLRGVVCEISRCLKARSSNLTS